MKPLFILLVSMMSTIMQARAPIAVTDGGPMAGSIYRREAFVITTDTRGLRFYHTAQALTSLGFDVRPFAPVGVRDSRVLEMEEKYIRVNESVGMARRAISLTLTHAELWYAAARLGCRPLRRVRTCPRPLGPTAAPCYSLKSVSQLCTTVRACRRRFPSRPTHDWLYVFEDDVMLEPRLSQYSEDVLCYLSAIEKLASERGSPMIYLDRPSAAFPVKRSASQLKGSAKQKELQRKQKEYQFRRSTGFACARSTNQTTATNGVMKGASARLDFSIYPCAPLCTHAYAIRRQDAAGFYSKIRSHLERAGRLSKRFKLYDYYRYNLDVDLKGYFITHKSFSPLQWPTCIRMSGQGFTGLTSLIIQNASMPKVVGWHGARTNSYMYK